MPADSPTPDGHKTLGAAVPDDTYEALREFCQQESQRTGQRYTASQLIRQLVEDYLQAHQRTPKAKSKGPRGV